MSMNNGTTWTPVNSGLTNLAVRSLAINSDGYIFAGTEGSGVFRSVKTTTFVGEISGTAPATYSLYQNYPNPFNPSTTIEFSIPRNAHVMLRVYDVLGEQVTTLVSDNLSAGRHRVEWNATGFPSGVYFYRLQAGEVMQTRKLLLVK
jgi:hypothetical protein